MMGKVDLGVEFCGVHFLNPFILAASPSTDNKEMIARAFEAGWAGAVMKTTSVESEEVDLAYPMMSSTTPGRNMVGLQNIDLISERHIEMMAEDALWLKERFPEYRLAMSIVAGSREDLAYLVRYAEQAGVDLIELSISCPQGSFLEDEENTEGFMISQDQRLTEKVTRWSKQAAAHVPIYVKLSPGVTDISSIARAVERGGGDGICAIDSVEAIAGIDLDTLSPLPSVQGYSSRGGYTGRAIKPVGLRCVADIAQSVDLPITGVGGIYDWRDALEYISLGASTLQVCTAVMHLGFRIVTDMCDGLERWMSIHEYERIDQIVGLSLPKVVDHEKLPRGSKMLSKVKQELCIGCGLCYVACRDGGHMAIDFGPERIPIILEDACVGCGLCAQVCPVPACIEICAV
jgi:dihydropyrimidine dehydrogenase (NAD+) subunit PreA